jgi:RNA polymerase sigma factor (sigma-70 family)
MGMAMSVVGASTAEDLVQESLVQVLARYPAFEGVRLPLAYSKTVLARLAFRGGSRAEVPDDITDQLESSAERDFAEDLALRSIVVGAIDQLPPRQRACVYLRYVEGLDDREISKTLGCREVTVRTQISRALRTLRPILLQAGVSNA